MLLFVKQNVKIKSPNDNNSWIDFHNCRIDEI